jgi:hypothetical protein
MNIIKTTEVHQGPDESLGQFSKRLCDASHLYTPFDSEVGENQGMINAAFVSQAQGDIRQKLQKLEGFAGMNARQLWRWPQKSLSVEVRKPNGRPTER